MKKIIVIMIVALLSGLQSKAQKKDSIPENKGQWFVFIDNKYHLTKGDILEIAKSMPAMKHEHHYKLSNGKSFFVYYPQEWLTLMKTILTKVKKKEVKNVADALSTGEIVPWDDNISVTTKNYGVNKSGQPFVVDDNYHGGKEKDAFVVDGYPVLKTFKPCINPNEPYIVSKPADTLPFVQKKEEEKKDTTKQAPPKTTKEYIPESSGRRGEVVKTEKIPMGKPVFTPTNNWSRPVYSEPKTTVWDFLRGMWVTVNISGSNRRGGNIFNPLPDQGPVGVPGHGSRGPVGVPGHN